MRREKSCNVRLTCQEEAMIRLVNRHNPPRAVYSPCLTDEEIAGFLDGVLEGDDRDRVVRHLADCGDCYEILADTMQTAGSVEESRGSGRRRVPATLLIPLAIAASLVLFLAASQFNRRSASLPMQSRTTGALPSVSGTPGQSASPKHAPNPADDGVRRTRPSAAGIAGSLAQVADRERMAGFAEVYAPGQQGFSGGASRTRTLFLAGMLLTDLEIAIRADNRERSLECLKGLGDYFRSAKGWSIPAGLCARVAEKIENGSRLLRLRGFSAMIEDSFETEDAMLISFGSWVEGARVSAHFNYSSFFSPATVRFFIEQIPSSSGVTEKTVAQLVEIESILTETTPDGSKFRRLENLLESIRDLM